LFKIGLISRYAFDARRDDCRRARHSATTLSHVVDEGIEPGRVWRPASGVPRGNSAVRASRFLVNSETCDFDIPTIRWSAPGPPPWPGPVRPTAGSSKAGLGALAELVNLEVERSGPGAQAPGGARSCASPDSRCSPARGPLHKAGRTRSPWAAQLPYSPSRRTCRVQPRTPVVVHELTRAHWIGDFSASSASSVGTRRI